jgi:branched-chain amino acid transport system substrate-binding protein
MIKYWITAILAALAVSAIACAPTPAQAPTATPSRVAVGEGTSEPTIVPDMIKTPETTPTPSDQDRPIRIGLLIDRTGALADFGAMLENGFALGLDYAMGGDTKIAGRTVQLVTRDTTSNVDTGILAARDLIEKENVDILIASPITGIAQAASDLAKQSKKIVIHTSSNHDLTGRNYNPYAFRASRTIAQDAIALAVSLTRKGKAFAQIAPDNSLGRVTAATFYNAVRTYGGQFTINNTPDRVGTIFISPDAKDFVPQVKQIQDAKPDTLIVTWTGAGFNPLFSRLQQQDAYKSMTVGVIFPDNQSVKNGFVSAVGTVGVISYHYTLPKNSVNDWLVEKYKQRFATPPDILAESGFVAAQMAIAGLKATNGDPSGDKLIQALEKLSFDGPKGKYSVRDYDHVLLQSEYFAKITTTTDSEFKFFDLLSELKPEDIAPPCLLDGEFKSRCPVK